MADQVNANETPVQAEQKVVKQQKNGEKKYRAPQLQSTAAVKIGELQPRNNNSNFIGKVIEIQVLEKGNNKQGNPRKFLKGLVGDETGVVRFDLAVKDGVIFDVDNIVCFDKAMNKVNKDGHHYVEIKRFGRYEVLKEVTVASVNNENNLSTKIIPPLPESEKKQKPLKKFNNSQNKNQTNNNNHNHSNNNNNNNNNNSNNNRNNNNNINNNNNNNNRGGQKNKMSNNNNNTNNNNNNNGNNNNNNGNNNNNNNTRNFKKPQHKRFHQALPTPIKSLAPGNNGQTVKGKVFDVQSYTKTIKNNESTFFKGRVADESANINFDFMMKQDKTITEGDMVIFTNIMNKVNEEGHHYIVVGKYGQYSVLNEKQINIKEQENKSSFDYSSQVTKQ